MVDKTGAPKDPSKRRALDWLLGSWLAGVCGAVFYPVMKYLVPPEITEAPTLSVKGGGGVDVGPEHGAPRAVRASPGDCGAAQER